MEAGVVSLAQGAMGSLLEKLALLLVDEYKLVKGAKRQIKLLQKELEVMNIFLKHISQEEDPDDLYKHQANAVRELSYDIEDSIDEFKLRVERNSNSKPHGCKGFVERCVNLLTTMKIRHKQAKEFQDLLSRAKDVSERHTLPETGALLTAPSFADCQIEGSRQISPLPTAKRGSRQIHCLAVGKERQSAKNSLPTAGKILTVGKVRQSAKLGGRRRRPSQ